MSVRPPSRIEESALRERAALKEEARSEEKASSHEAVSRLFSDDALKRLASLHTELDFYKKEKEVLDSEKPEVRTELISSAIKKQKQHIESLDPTPLFIEKSRKKIRELRQRHRSHLPKIRRIECGSNVVNIVFFVAYILATIAPLFWDIPHWTPFLVMGSSCLIGCFMTPFVLWADNKKQKFQRNVKFYKILIAAYKRQSSPYLVTEADVIQIDPRLPSDKRTLQSALARKGDLFSRQSLDSDAIKRINRQSALYSTREYQALFNKYGLIEGSSATQGFFRSLAARISKKESETLCDIVRQAPQTTSPGLMRRLRAAKKDLIDPRLSFTERTTKHYNLMLNLLGKFRGFSQVSEDNHFLVTTTIDAEKRYQRLFEKSRMQYFKLQTVCERFGLVHDIAPWDKIPIVIEKSRFVPEEGLLMQWGYAHYWEAKMEEFYEGLCKTLNCFSFDSFEDKIRTDILENCYIPKMDSPFDLVVFSESFKDDKGHINIGHVNRAIIESRKEPGTHSEFFTSLEQEMRAYVDLRTLFKEIKREGASFDAGYYVLPEITDSTLSSVRDLKIFIESLRGKFHFLSKKEYESHDHRVLLENFKKEIDGCLDGISEIERRKLEGVALICCIHDLKQRLQNNLLDSIIALIKKRYRPPTPKLLDQLQEKHEKLFQAIKEYQEAVRETASREDVMMSLRGFRADYQDLEAQFLELGEPQKYYGHLLQKDIKNIILFFNSKKKEKITFGKFEQKYLLPLYEHCVELNKQGGSDILKKLQQDIEALGNSCEHYFDKKISKRMIQKSLTMLDSDLEFLDTNLIKEKRTSLRKFAKRQPAEPYKKAMSQEEEILVRSLKQIDRKIDKKVALLDVAMIVLAVVAAVLEVHFHDDIYFSIAFFSTFPFLAYGLHSFKKKSLGKDERVKRIFKLTYFLLHNPQFMNKKYATPLVLDKKERFKNWGFHLISKTAPKMTVLPKKRVVIDEKGDLSSRRKYQSILHKYGLDDKRDDSFGQLRQALLLSRDLVRATF